MPKVSVIIPVYGVEKYIERCARSLFEQTLEDMEFIFVDDYTKDNSIEVLKHIIKDYPNRQSQIKIVRHEINKGLPQARATGFGYVTGEYVAHCDSDDWVDREMYQQIYDKAITENADMVICEYFISDGENKRVYHISETNGLLMGPVWNKIINRRLYENDIEFPTANKAEDGAIMTQVSYFSKKRVYIHKPLYYYFLNPASICRQIDETSCISKMEQECENVNLRLNFLKRKNELSKYYKDIIVWKFEARNNLIPCISKKQIFDLWKKTYPEIDNQIFMSGNFRMIVKYLLLRCKLHFLIKYFR